MTDTVPRPARGPLSPAALALRLVCEATSRALWGAAWRPGITELGWRLATEPVDSVTVDDGDESALADARAGDGEAWQWLWQTAPEWVQWQRLPAPVIVQMSFDMRYGELSMALETGQPGPKPRR